MADTLQTVDWALERACPLRRGQNWTDPHVTRNQLWRAWGYAVGREEGRVFEDICVTTTQFGNGIDIELPIGGFTISTELGPLGGESLIRAACLPCEANVRHDDKRGVVGCHGSVHVPPRSPELDARIGEAISATGTEAELAAAFQVTAPRWYGFWISSPINPPACRLLYRVLREADIAELARGGEAFLLALERPLSIHCPCKSGSIPQVTWTWASTPFSPTALAAKRKPISRGGGVAIDWKSGSAWCAVSVSVRLRRL